MPETEAQDELRISTSQGAISVFVGDSNTPILVQNAQPDHRPFVHPILVPDGHVSVTQDAPSHHPWQHGIYIGLNDVNGAGFWSEGLHPTRSGADGTFHPRIVGAPTVSGSRATWIIETEYRNRHGDALLIDTQRWSIEVDEGRYVLDLDLTLHALQDLRFGQYPYGGLFIRMPYDARRGGAVRNDVGQVGADAEGQRARWVSVEMPIDDEFASVTTMDHPSNRQHPVPWRVDNELGVGPSPSIVGPWQLGKGEDERFAYRLTIAGSSLSSSELDRRWDEFSKKEYK